MNTSPSNMQIPGKQADRQISDAGKAHTVVGLLGEEVALHNMTRQSAPECWGVVSGGGLLPWEQKRLKTRVEKLKKEKDRKKENESAKQNVQKQTNKKKPIMITLYI